MTNDELRALAEQAKRHDRGRGYVSWADRGLDRLFYAPAEGKFVTACSPDRILALLDRIATLEARLVAAEKVVEAARKFKRNPTTSWSALEEQGFHRIHDALAALDSEGRTDTASEALQEGQK